MYFPVYRPRRLRRTEALRGMIRETELNARDFIYPLFVVPGTGVKKEISSMPGVFQLSQEQLVKEAAAAHALGVPAVILFGIPEEKDAVGSHACRDDGVVQRAIEALKRDLPSLVVITDVCLCEYTDHGHCGIIENGRRRQRPDAEAPRAGGAQPRPRRRRHGRALGHDGRPRRGDPRRARRRTASPTCRSWPTRPSTPPASTGPSARPPESTPQFGDRRSYQMDPANGSEALRETRLDVEEGADIVMVKPALSYLDIIAAIHTEFDLPVAAYNVSGEYAMVKAAAAKGWIDGDRVMLEILTSIKRAGADMILTYHAKEAAALLKARA